MTVLTTDGGADTRRPGVTLPRVLHSEWIKLRSVRALTVGLAATAVLLMALGPLSSSAMAKTFAAGTEIDDAPFVPTTPVGAVLGGVFFAQLLTGALGVLFMSTEYATGMIRASLAAVPTRLPLLWGKALVFGAVVATVGAISVAVSFLGSVPLLDGHGVAPSLSDPGVPRALAATPAYLAGIGLIGVALAVLMRSTALAVTTVCFAVFLLDSLAGLLPASLADEVTPYLPATTGKAMLTVQNQPDLLDPLPACLVFAGYVIASLAAAGVALARRDA